MNRRMLHIALAALPIALMLLAACVRRPDLHLYDEEDVTKQMPTVDLDLDLDLQVYWDYQLSYDVSDDWQAEWHYGWDNVDRSIFGEIGYTEPTAFHLRRYYTELVPYGPHASMVADHINGKSYRGTFEWGFWDMLVWNEIKTVDGIQSIIIDESPAWDHVVAYTNQTQHASRYQAPRYTQSFYEPEPLFAAYSQAVEINSDLTGFEFDPVRNVYVRKLNMSLVPLTYIYLTQVILHNNKNRIINSEGLGNLSGMARSVDLFSGVAGEDEITVNYNTRMKRDVAIGTEQVDIVGGKLMTFGLCNHNGNRITRPDDVHDTSRHYMDVTMQFNNGKDSTFVFDVTKQVRQRWKGGVITIELDVDTIPIPTRSGGSGFDAVVKDVEDGGTWEIDFE